MRKAKIYKVQIGLALLGLLIANAAFLPRVLATTYTTHNSVILTNMNAGGASSIILEFTPNSTTAALTMQFSTAGTNWTGSGGTGTVATVTAATTFNTVNCKTITGATNNFATPTPTVTATAGTGLLTFGSPGTFTAGQSYCTVLPSVITALPTAAGQSIVTITAASDAATTAAIDTITNDQVVVSAIVDPTFTLALSSNTDAFTAHLASGSVGATTGVTATVNTNAKNGWFLFGTDSNTGLNSATQSKTIASLTPGTNGTLSAGTEGYLTGITSITAGSGAGTTTASNAYGNGSGGTAGAGQGSGLDTTERQIASSTGTANGAVVTVKESAAISAITPAAIDYSDTITLVGAGSF
jgi:hypothetical protein